ESFRSAAGEVEVQVDAGKVNTTTGWRDLKVVGFAKRPSGPAATPDQWDRRELPGPTARVVLADIEGIDTFRRDWRGWADRLRMKARGSRWVERNAEHMSALVALSNSTLWEHYWANAA